MRPLRTDFRPSEGASRFPRSSYNLGTHLSVNELLVWPYSHTDSHLHAGDPSRCAVLCITAGYSVKASHGESDINCVGGGSGSCRISGARARIRSSESVVCCNCAGRLREDEDDIRTIIQGVQQSTRPAGRHNEPITAFIMFCATLRGPRSLRLHLRCFISIGEHRQTIKLVNEAHN